MLVMGRIGKTMRLTREHSKTGDGMDLITERKGEQEETRCDGATGKVAV